MGSLRMIFGSGVRGAYLGLQTCLIKPLVLPRFFSQERLTQGQADWERLEKMVLNAPSLSSRIWFHASSVGELETLWPLIQSFGGRGAQVIVTILSESACQALAKLTRELEASGVLVLFSGYSPWEGGWATALDRLKPQLLITARYEAWPELWVALSDRKIPLGIVAARDRKSLRIAKSLCRWMGRPHPELFLFTCTESDGDALKVQFPGASIQYVGDPRWDRVYERSSLGNPRAAEMVKALRELPRPWGVLGSAWLEDLKFLFPHILKKGGTLFVVPHRIDREAIEAIEKFLGEQKLKVIRTRHQSAQELNQSVQPGTVILVDEMGFLSELYAAADWAWVGGGFGKGIHSILEPAIHGIPVGIGPQGSERFSEVVELGSTGQLSVISHLDQLLRWMEQPILAEQQTRWKQDVSAKLGASERVIQFLIARL